MPTSAAPAIDGASHVHSGKVRDLYELPDGRLLMVASDRISAFDFILETTIPDKGEILLMMARGLTNAEIAGELFVSETTVKTHVGRVLMKLGLRDRVQVVIFAYESGLVNGQRA